MYKTTQKKTKISQASPEMPVLTKKELRPFDLASSVSLPQTDGHSISKMKLVSSQNQSFPFLQAKLTISQPGDKYEQEADTMASQVVNQIHSPTSDNLAREEMPQEDQEDAVIQTKKPTNLPNLTETSQELESAIEESKGNGQPLSDQIRQPMEKSFNADFNDVRIHTDSKSDQLNKSIQAKAFTTGKDIFFRQGAYDAASKSGQALIAHELTHVVQQNGGNVQRQAEKKI